MYLLFIDIETTGLYYYKHGMHQIGGIIRDIDNDESYTFELKFKPNVEADIEQEALDVSNTDINEMNSREVSEQQAIQQMINSLNEFAEYSPIMLVGWRVGEFDIKFIEEAFKRCDKHEAFKRIFSRTSIDVKSLAVQYLLKDIESQEEGLEHLHLDTIAEYLGIQVDHDRLHNALYDAELCEKIYNRVVR